MLESEGERGFADDDYYTSDEYNTFDDCCEEMKRFNPKHRWKHLRYIRGRKIYRGDVLVKEL
jgi:hypothetical protein